MKSMKSLLTASLAALVLSSCGPNLSTPENTLSTFLKTAKSNKDPMKVCGYKEKIEDFGPYIYSNSNREINYYRPFIMCAEDVSKCIEYDGMPTNTRVDKELLREIDLIVTQDGKLPGFDWHKKNERGITYFPKNSGNYLMMKILLQKEKDGKWRVINDRRTEFIFNNQ